MGGRLRPSQFGARFGLPAARLAQLRRDLRVRRLTVARLFPQRTAMQVRGTVGELESVFATRLVDRLDARGRRYFAPVTRPRIPGWLAADVQGVTGLSTQPVMRAADVPAGGLDPGTLGKAYDIAPLRAQGMTGAGQTVAVISFDSFENADLSAFQSRFGITGPAVQHVQVHGGTLPGSGQQEVNLDVDTIRSIAPGAEILDYEAPQGATTDADVINQIVADHRARVISSSWGRCDLLVTDAERSADETALAAARAAGITVFAASGDNGAYDCQAEDLTDQRLSVDWPAASENVVAVGGTRLAVRKDGTYLAEYGWEDVLKGDGSGGGLASATGRPGMADRPRCAERVLERDAPAPRCRRAGRPGQRHGRHLRRSGASGRRHERRRPVLGRHAAPGSPVRAAPRRPRPRVRRADAVRDRGQPTHRQRLSPFAARRKPALQRHRRLELRRRSRLARRRGARPGPRRGVAGALSSGRVRVRGGGGSRGSLVRSVVTGVQAHREGGFGFGWARVRVGVCGWVSGWAVAPWSPDRLRDGPAGRG